MLDNRAELRLHPEGLTSSEEQLLDLFHETRMESTVRRRRTRSDDSHEFYTVTHPTAPIDITDHPEEHVFKIHEQHPELPLARLKINLRNLPDTVLDLLGNVMAERMQRIKKPEVCTGIPEAGVPLGKYYALHADVPYLDIFKKEVLGERRKVIGRKEINGNGRNIVLIDDVITQGLSKIEAIDAAQTLGFSVSDVFVIVDRRQDTSRLPYSLHSVYTLDQILQYYLRTGKFTKITHDQIKQNLEEMRHFPI